MTVVTLYKWYYHLVVKQTKLHKGFEFGWEKQNWVNESKCYWQKNTRILILIALFLKEHMWQISFKQRGFSLKVQKRSCLN